MSEVKAVAWMHHVIDDAGDSDEALSFSPDHFPLEGVAGYRKVSCEPLVPESAIAALQDRLLGKVIEHRDGRLAALERAEEAEARAARLEADNARLREALVISAGRVDRLSDGLRGAFNAMQISYHDNTAIRFHEMGAVMDLSAELGVRLCGTTPVERAALAEKEGGNEDR